MQNLKVVAVRPDDGVILISGAVPGPMGGYVTVRAAKKKPAFVKKSATDATAATDTTAAAKKKTA